MMLQMTQCLTVFRSAYESAYYKVEKLKQSKKEKEKLDAEEEVESAKQRL